MYDLLRSVIVSLHSLKINLKCHLNPMDNVSFLWVPFNVKWNGYISFENLLLILNTIPSLPSFDNGITRSVSKCVNYRLNVITSLDKTRYRYLYCLKDVRKKCSNEKLQFDNFSSEKCLDTINWFRNWKTNMSKSNMRYAVLNSVLWYCFLFWIENIFLCKSDYNFIRSLKC